MINEESLRAIEDARLNDQFIKPLYNSYCFSQIPYFIQSLLTSREDMGFPASVLGNLPKHYDKVILFFIDAFGWRFFAQHYEKYPFLNRIVQDGVASKITSQFPSTTAAHVTTIHTGLPVGESGVYEWFYYDPAVDSVIAPLLFSFAGDRDRNTLARTGVNPEALYPKKTFYRQLKSRNIKTYLFQHRAYTPSPYSDVVFKGAQVIPYNTLSEALVNLTDALLLEKRKAYFFLYFDSIDSICHRYGPESRHVAAEIDTLLTVLERLFHASVVGKLKHTLLLVTADHGQIGVDPAKTIYLNRDLPQLVNAIKISRDGQPLVPAGSCRDMFFYIKDDQLDEVHATLQKHLEGKAQVAKVSDLIAQNFFGATPPSPAFMSRVGNLAILAQGHEAVWWYEKDKYEQKLLGHHGGLSRAEMETILLAYPYV